MAINPSNLEQKSIMIGKLIHEARRKTNHKADECAKAIGVSTEQFKAYERGEKSISLPELEAVAFFLDVPIEHFWARETSALGDNYRVISNLEQLLPLRNRMIGAMLRQARLEAGLTLEALAMHAEIDATRLEAFELGEESVPVPELEALSGMLQRSIREFQDQYGPVGIWNAQQRALHNFLLLPLDLQLFIAKPVNRPYLDLAVRLSDMSVEKLRAVAEGLLEITY
jgi:transcriptional regulator with XRE-family HTH domain